MSLFGQFMVAGWLIGWAFIGWVVFINLLKGGYFRRWWQHFTTWIHDRGGNPYWAVFLIIVFLIFLFGCHHG